MEKKKRETEGKGEDPAGTAFPHGSHSTCKVEPERAEPGQNSRGLVNRTIVKHLPSFPFIYIYICIFFSFSLFFLLVLLHPKRVDGGGGGGLHSDICLSLAIFTI